MRKALPDYARISAPLRILLHGIEHNSDGGRRRKSAISTMSLNGLWTATHHSALLGIQRRLQVSLESYSVVVSLENLDCLWFGAAMFTSEQTIPIYYMFSFVASRSNAQNTQLGTCQVGRNAKQIALFYVAYYMRG